MRNQSWLPDGTLIQDQEILTDITGIWFIDHITGTRRLATPAEISLLPDPELTWVQTTLATSPDAIPMPATWRLLRYFAKRLGITS